MLSRHPFFQDGLEKNGVIFDHNIDSSSETTEGAYRMRRCGIRIANPHNVSPSFFLLWLIPPRPRRPALCVPEWEDESPYPEVRAAVSNTDDMEMPVDTFRVWTIGLFWAVFIPGLNQFLFFRYPSIQIGSVRDLFFLLP